ncbi:MAG: hypothetical protein JXB34_09195 [Bacteroidales bacterium]|nr:hypothetical protein [Bacteroidales bacterium]
MRKLFSTFIIMALSGVTAFSQLSTRENDASVVKLGSRPGAGDMSLTFGAALTGGGVADLPIVNQLAQGDILTFKRYTDANTAFRLGIKLYKDSDKLKGDEIDMFGDFVQSSFIKNSESEFIIAPGIEKHFNSKNIFDVYAGSDLFLGFKRNLTIEEYNYDGGDYDKYRETSSPIVLGLGGVVGFNVFIAHLPISLGLEYGLNMKWTNEGKSKVKYETSTAGTTESQVYYVSANDPLTTYSKLKVSEVGINTNSNVRLVLNIYFGQ